MTQKQPVKLFYVSEESVTIALRKLRVQNNVRTGKGPLTLTDSIKLVLRFEKTGMLVDHVKTGQPCLRKARSPRVAGEMEELASGSAGRDQQCS